MLQGMMKVSWMVYCCLSTAASMHVPKLQTMLMKIKMRMFRILFSACQ